MIKKRKEKTRDECICSLNLFIVSGRSLKDHMLTSFYNVYKNNNNRKLYLVILTETPFERMWLLEAVRLLLRHTYCVLECELACV